MIYSSNDISGIENAYDRYLFDGYDDYNDDGTWYDDGYGFEEYDDER